MAYLKLLKQVHPAPFSSSFEGQILQPGGYLESSALGDNPVLIECAGPIGRGRNRDYLWILWRYDRTAGEWKEIARAHAADASWTYALREPALMALHPSSQLFDIKEKASDLAILIVGHIEHVLMPHPEPIQGEVLNRVYDHVAGKLAVLGS